MKITNGKKIYSPSEVNYFSKETLEQMVVWVEGEVASLKKNPSWNFYYLDLKDERATLPALVEGHLVDELNTDILNQTIIAFGNLTLYEPQGRYQLKIKHIELSGEGEFYKKLEQLIKKLKTEGLFDPAHKKAIPKFPKRVCLVTSVGSDAANDFTKHSIDKFPIIELYTADTRVQGAKSISQLTHVLPKVDKMNFDVVVITRGGGSLEDLAAFNSEEVARAIFKMQTPTVVAIGHEANESLAEWVADRRASTPTDAANIVTESYQSILEKLDYYRLCIKSKYESTSSYFQKLDYLFVRLTQAKVTIREFPLKLSTFEQSLKRHQGQLVYEASHKIEYLCDKLKREALEIVTGNDQKLTSLYKSLNLLSPPNTLKRGYSITTSEEGTVIRTVDKVVIGQSINVKLSGGTLKSKVMEKHE